MAYSLRKWCTGETTGLQLHVVGPTGRTVFSSPSYEKTVAERDRLNAGGDEAVTNHHGNRRNVPQRDGAVRVEISPEEIRPFY